MLKSTTMIAVALGLAASITLAGVAKAEGLIIGVAWASFQEERWKTDETAIKAELARRLGARPATVDRLLDIAHASRLEQLDAALAALGKRLDVKIRNAA